jgi:hypothetical protein
MTDVKRAIVQIERGDTVASLSMRELRRLLLAGVVKLTYPKSIFPGEREYDGTWRQRGDGAVGGRAV